MGTASFDALYYPSYVPDSDWAKVQFLIWDKIHRIVPYDMQSTFGDDYVADTFGIDPDAMPMMQPFESDLEYFDMHKTALEHAFGTIRGSVKGNLKDMESFGIHPSKAPQWLFGMLEDMGLARIDEEEIEDQWRTWHKKHYWVHRDAADLVMSCLGSRMASRRGLEGITDREMSFYLTAASEISEDTDDRARTSQEQALAMQVFRFFVPQDIDLLSFDQVFELRNEYSGLRSAFHRTVRRVAQEHKLEGIVDKQWVEERLGECVQEFNDEERKFRRSWPTRALGNPVVQTIGVLLGGVGAAIAGGPAVGLALTLGGTAVALINAAVDKPESSELEQTFRYFYRVNRKLDVMTCAKGVTGLLQRTQRRLEREYGVG